MFLEIALNYMDLFVLALCAIFGIIGFFKGFLKQVGKIISIVVTVVLCIMFFKQLASLIQGLGFVSEWQQKLLEWLNSKGELFSTGMRDLGEDKVKSALDSLRIPPFIMDPIIEKINFETLPEESLAAYIAPRLIEYACYAIAFLVIFVVTIIVVSILIKILSKVINIVPLAGLANRLLGLAFGVLKIGLILWVAFYAVSFLSVVPSIQEAVNNFISKRIVTDDSVVVSFVYEHNLLIDIINALLAK